MGAGDGRFVFEAAGRDPATLYMALDPAADRMAAMAGKAARRRLANALFVQAAVEALPPELAGAATSISINFPWGSLLKALAAPEPGVLAAIASLGRPVAKLTLLVNMSVFDDGAYCARLGLPCPPVFGDAEKTGQSYAAAGLAVARIIPDADGLPYKTTWGQKLTKGTRRRILQLDAAIAPRV